MESKTTLRTSSSAQRVSPAKRRPVNESFCEFDIIETYEKNRHTRRSRSKKGASNTELTKKINEFSARNAKIEEIYGNKQVASSSGDSIIVDKSDTSKSENRLSSGKSSREKNLDKAGRYRRQHASLEPYKNVYEEERKQFRQHNSEERKHFNAEERKHFRELNKEERNHITGINLDERKQYQNLERGFNEAERKHLRNLNPDERKRFKEQKTHTNNFSLEERNNFNIYNYEESQTVEEFTLEKRKHLRAFNPEERNRNSEERKHPEERNHSRNFNSQERKEFRDFKREERKRFRNYNSEERRRLKSEEGKYYKDLKFDNNNNFSSEEINNQIVCKYYNEPTDDKRVITVYENANVNLGTDFSESMNSKEFAQFQWNKLDVKKSVKEYEEYLRNVVVTNKNAILEVKSGYKIDCKQLNDGKKKTRRKLLQNPTRFVAESQNGNVNDCKVYRMNTDGTIEKVGERLSESFEKHSGGKDKSEKAAELKNSLQDLLKSEKVSNRLKNYQEGKEESSKVLEDMETTKKRKDKHKRRKNTVDKGTDQHEEIKVQENEKQRNKTKVNKNEPEFERMLNQQFETSYFEERHNAKIANLEPRVGKKGNDERSSEDGRSFDIKNNDYDVDKMEALIKHQKRKKEHKKRDSTNDERASKKDSEDHNNLEQKLNNNVKSKKREERTEDFIKFEDKLKNKDHVEKKSDECSKLGKIDHEEQLKLREEHKRNEHTKHSRKKDQKVQKCDDFNKPEQSKEPDEEINSAVIKHHKVEFLKFEKQLRKKDHEEQKKLEQQSRKKERHSSSKGREELKGDTTKNEQQLKNDCDEQGKKDFKDYLQSLTKSCKVEKSKKDSENKEKHGLFGKRKKGETDRKKSDENLNENLENYKRKKRNSSKEDKNNQKKSDHDSEKNRIKQDGECSFDTKRKVEESVFKVEGKDIKFKDVEENIRRSIQEVEHNRRRNKNEIVDNKNKNGAESKKEHHDRTKSRKQVEDCNNEKVIDEYKINNNSVGDYKTRSKKEVEDKGIEVKRRSKSNDEGKGERRRKSKEGAENLIRHRKEHLNNLKMNKEDVSSNQKEANDWETRNNEDGKNRTECGTNEDNRSKNKKDYKTRYLKEGSNDRKSKHNENYIYESKEEKEDYSNLSNVDTEDDRSRSKNEQVDDRYRKAIEDDKNNHSELEGDLTKFVTDYKKRNQVEMETKHRKLKWNHRKDFEELENGLKTINMLEKQKLEELINEKKFVSDQTKLQRKKQLAEYDRKIPIIHTSSNETINSQSEDNSTISTSNNGLFEKIKPPTSATTETSRSSIRKTIIEVTAEESLRKLLDVYKREQQHAHQSGIYNRKEFRTTINVLRNQKAKYTQRKEINLNLSLCKSLADLNLVKASSKTVLALRDICKVAELEKMRMKCPKRKKSSLLVNPKKGISQNTKFHKCKHLVTNERIVEISSKMLKDEEVKFTVEGIEPVKKLLQFEPNLAELKIQRFLHRINSEDGNNKSYEDIDFTSENSKLRCVDTMDRFKQKCVSLRIQTFTGIDMNLSDVRMLNHGVYRNEKAFSRCSIHFEVPSVRTFPLVGNGSVVFSPRGKKSFNLLGLKKEMKKKTRKLEVYNNKALFVSNQGNILKSVVIDSTTQTSARVEVNPGVKKTSVFEQIRKDFDFQMVESKAIQKTNQNDVKRIEDQNTVKRRKSQSPSKIPKLSNFSSSSCYPNEIRVGGKSNVDQKEIKMDTVQKAAGRDNIQKEVRKNDNHQDQIQKEVIRNYHHKQTSRDNDKLQGNKQVIDVTSPKQIGENKLKTTPLASTIDYNKRREIRTLAETRRNIQEISCSSDEITLRDRSSSETNHIKQLNTSSVHSNINPFAGLLKKEKDVDNQSKSIRRRSSSSAEILLHKRDFVQEKPLETLEIARRREIENSRERFLAKRSQSTHFKGRTNKFVFIDLSSSGLEEKERESKREEIRSATYPKNTLSSSLERLSNRDTKKCSQKNLVTRSKESSPQRASKIPISFQRAKSMCVPETRKASESMCRTASKSEDCIQGNQSRLKASKSALLKNSKSFMRVREMSVEASIDSKKDFCRNKKDCKLKQSSAVNCDDSSVFDEKIVRRTFPTANSKLSGNSKKEVRKASLSPCRTSSSMSKRERPRYSSESRRYEMESMNNSRLKRNDGRCKQHAPAAEVKKNIKQEAEVVKKRNLKQVEDTNKLTKLDVAGIENEKSSNKAKANQEIRRVELERNNFPKRISNQIPIEAKKVVPKRNVNKESKLIEVDNKKLPNAKSKQEDQNSAKKNQSSKTQEYKRNNDKIKAETRTEKGINAIQTGLRNKEVEQTENKSSKYKQRNAPISRRINVKSKKSSSSDLSKGSVDLGDQNKFVNEDYSSANEESIHRKDVSTKKKESEIFSCHRDEIKALEKCLNDILLKLSKDDDKKCEEKHENDTSQCPTDHVFNPCKKKSKEQLNLMKLKEDVNKCTNKTHEGGDKLKCNDGGIFTNSSKTSNSTEEEYLNQCYQAKPIKKIQHSKQIGRNIKALVKSRSSLYTRKRFNKASFVANKKNHRNAVMEEISPSFNVKLYKGRTRESSSYIARKSKQNRKVEKALRVGNNKRNKIEQTTLCESRIRKLDSLDVFSFSSQEEEERITWYKSCESLERFKEEMKMKQMMLEYKERNNDRTQMLKKKHVDVSDSELDIRDMKITIEPKENKWKQNSPKIFAVNETFKYDNDASKNIEKRHLKNLQDKKCINIHDLKTEDIEDDSIETLNVNQTSSIVEIFRKNCTPKKTTGVKRITKLFRKPADLQNATDIIDFNKNGMLNNQDSYKNTNLSRKKQEEKIRYIFGTSIVTDTENTKKEEFNLKSPIKSSATKDNINKRKALIDEMLRKNKQENHSGRSASIENAIEEDSLFEESSDDDTSWQMAHEPLITKKDKFFGPYSLFNSKEELSIDDKLFTSKEDLSMQKESRKKPLYTSKEDVSIRMNSRKKQLYNARKEVSVHFDTRRDISPFNNSRKPLYTSKEDISVDDKETYTSREELVTEESSRENLSFGGRIKKKFFARRRSKEEVNVSVKSKPDKEYHFKIGGLKMLKRVRSKTGEDEEAKKRDDMETEKVNKRELQNRGTLEEMKSFIRNTFEDELRRKHAENKDDEERKTHSPEDSRRRHSPEEKRKGSPINMKSRCSPDEMRRNYPEKVRRFSPDDMRIKNEVNGMSSRFITNEIRKVAPEVMVGRMSAHPKHIRKYTTEEKSRNHSPEEIRRKYHPDKIKATVEIKDIWKNNNMNSSARNNETREYNNSKVSRNLNATNNKEIFNVMEKSLLQSNLQKPCTRRTSKRKLLSSRENLKIPSKENTSSAKHKPGKCSVEDSTFKAKLKNEERRQNEHQKHSLRNMKKMAKKGKLSIESLNSVVILSHTPSKAVLSKSSVYKHQIGFCLNNDVVNKSPFYMNREEGEVTCVDSLEKMVFDSNLCPLTAVFNLSPPTCAYHVYNSFTIYQKRVQKGKKTEDVSDDETIADAADARNVDGVTNENVNLVKEVLGNNEARERSKKTVEIGANTIASKIFVKTLILPDITGVTENKSPNEVSKHQYSGGSMLKHVTNENNRREMFDGSKIKPNEARSSEYKKTTVNTSGATKLTSFESKDKEPEHRDQMPGPSTQITRHHISKIEAPIKRTSSEIFDAINIWNYNPQDKLKVPHGIQIENNKPNIDSNLSKKLVLNEGTIVSSGATTIKPNKLKTSNLNEVSALKSSAISNLSEPSTSDTKTLSNITETSKSDITMSGSFENAVNLFSQPQHENITAETSKREFKCINFGKVNAEPSGLEDEAYVSSSGAETSSDEARVKSETPTKKSAAIYETYTKQMSSERIGLKTNIRFASGELISDNIQSAEVLILAKHQGSQAFVGQKSQMFEPLMFEKIQLPKSPIIERNNVSIEYVVTKCIEPKPAEPLPVERNKRSKTPTLKKSKASKKQNASQNKITSEKDQACKESKVQLNENTQESQESKAPGQISEVAETSALLKQFQLFKAKKNASEKGQVCNERLESKPPIDERTQESNISKTFNLRNTQRNQTSKTFNTNQHEKEVKCKATSLNDIEEVSYADSIAPQEEKLVSKPRLYEENRVSEAHDHEAFKDEKSPAPRPPITERKWYKELMFHQEELKPQVCEDKTQFEKGYRTSKGDDQKREILNNSPRKRTPETNVSEAHENILKLETDKQEKSPPRSPISERKWYKELMLQQAEALKTQVREDGYNEKQSEKGYRVNKHSDQIRVSVDETPNSSPRKYTLETSKDRNCSESPRSKSDSSDVEHPLLKNVSDGFQTWKSHSIETPTVSINWITKTETARPCLDYTIKAGASYVDEAQNTSGYQTKGSSISSSSYNKNICYSFSSSVDEGLSMNTERSKRYSTCSSIEEGLSNNPTNSSVEEVINSNEHRNRYSISSADKALTAKGNSIDEAVSTNYDLNRGSRSSSVDESMIKKHTKGSYMSSSIEEALNNKYTQGCSISSSIEDALNTSDYQAKRCSLSSSVEEALNTKIFSMSSSIEETLNINDEHTRGCSISEASDEDKHPMNFFAHDVMGVSYMPETPKVFTTWAEQSPRESNESSTELKALKPKYTKSPTLLTSKFLKKKKHKMMKFSEVGNAESKNIKFNYSTKTSTPALRKNMSSDGETPSTCELSSSSMRDMFASNESGYESSKPHSTNSIRNFFKKGGTLLEVFKKSKKISGRVVEEDERDLDLQNYEDAVKSSDSSRQIKLKDDKTKQSESSYDSGTMENSDKENYTHTKKEKSDLPRESKLDNYVPNKKKRSECDDLVRRIPEDLARQSVKTCDSSARSHKSSDLDRVNDNYESSGTIKKRRSRMLEGSPENCLRGIEEDYSRVYGSKTSKASNLFEQFMNKKRSRNNENDKKLPVWYTFGKIKKYEATKDPIKLKPCKCEEKTVYLRNDKDEFKEDSIMGRATDRRVDALQERLSQAIRKSKYMTQGSVKAIEDAKIKDLKQKLDEALRIQRENNLRKSAVMNELQHLERQAMRKSEYENVKKFTVVKQKVKRKRLCKCAVTPDIAEEREELEQVVVDLDKDDVKTRIPQNSSSILSIISLESQVSDKSDDESKSNGSAKSHISAQEAKLTDKEVFDKLLKNFERKSDIAERLSQNDDFFKDTLIPAVTKGNEEEEEDEESKNEGKKVILNKFRDPKFTDKEPEKKIDCSVNAEDIGTCFARGFRPDNMMLSGEACFHLNKQDRRKMNPYMLKNTESIIDFSERETPLDFLLALGFMVDEASNALKDDDIRSRLLAAITEARVWINRITTTQGTLLYLVAFKARPETMRYFLQLVEAIINKRINNAIKLDGFLRVLEQVEDGTIQMINILGEDRFEDAENEEKAVKRQLKRLFIDVYMIAEREAVALKKELQLEQVNLLRILVSKYRAGLLPHLELIARYIGQGLLDSNVQLEAAMIFLSRLDNADVKLKEFENYCGIHCQKETKKKR